MSPSSLWNFFFVFICRHFKVASSMLIVLMVSAWTTTAMIAYQNEHIPNADDPFALFDKIYDKPWTRLGPYMVGMCVGWFLFKTNCKIRMSRVSIDFKIIRHFSKFPNPHSIPNLFFSFHSRFDRQHWWLVGFRPASVCFG